MSAIIKPWARGPLEIIVDAEMHLRSGKDYDRRLALIGFDNAIEVSITIYLNLHPIQRNGEQYSNKDISEWLTNYHTKIDFFYDKFVRENHLIETIDKATVIWLHRNRNGQYHGDILGVPDLETLDNARAAALWVFSLLYDIDKSTLEQHIETEINNRIGMQWERESSIDKLIDSEYGLIEIAGTQYYASEILFSTDPAFYAQLGQELKELKGDVEHE